MRIRHLLVLFAALGSLTCRTEPVVAPPLAPPPPPPDAELLRSALDARCGPSARPATLARCEAARQLYGPAPRLLWWTAQGPSRQARALAAALEDAAARGLDPAHYASGGRAVLRAVKPAGAKLRAARDVALSLAALRLVSDLEVGRITPSEAGFELVPEAAAHDLVADVAALVRAQDVEKTLAALDPPFASYRWLGAALSRYRRLAGDPTLALSFSLPAGSLKPGAPFPKAPVLRRRLVATGDLSGPPPSDPGVYDRALAAGVAHFQARHGLTADGVLGRATLEALHVPLETRVRQIELAMERFRWLPHRFASPPLAVNIPEFRLFGLRADADRYVRADDQLSTRVIVGEAWQKQTPVFSSEIRSVVFWPFWGVPASIAEDEMLPALRRDPAYLARRHLELVEGYNDPAASALPPSEANRERLAAGTLRLRQRPGPHNELGLVKFLLPNPYGVYLHGSPARGLFARDRRDLSHGCIRVGDPLALALHVLRDEPGWTRERIETALRGPETLRVDLAQPVPVYVLYLTAVARADGSVHFFPDVYGLDERLRTLLEALPAEA